MRKSIVCVIAFIMILSSVGIGYAYTSILESANSFGSNYCSISPSDHDVIINQIKVKEFETESEIIPFLGFSSNGTDFQETLSVDYVHTRGTNIVLTIGFSCTTASDNPIIRCISNDTVLGSTSLMGESVKTGTITGIILSLSGGSTSGTVELSFQVEGIDLNTPVQISFLVYPLEVSS